MQLEASSAPCAAQGPAWRAVRPLARHCLGSPIFHLLARLTSTTSMAPFPFHFLFFSSETSGQQTLQYDKRPEQAPSSNSCSC